MRRVISGSNRQSGVATIGTAAAQLGVGANAHQAKSALLAPGLALVMDGSRGLSANALKGFDLPADVNHVANGG
jgi:hypothetical protein